VERVSEQQARIGLGWLLKDASEGRTPETGATVAKLMDEYTAVAEWDAPGLSGGLPPIR
jgi:hypothetical protein